MLGYHHQALEMEDGKKKLRVLSEMRKSSKSTDPTGMHLPVMVNAYHR
jgi:hypothetical protein